MVFLANRDEMNELMKLGISLNIFEIRIENEGESIGATLLLKKKDCWFF